MGQNVQKARSWLVGALAALLGVNLLVVLPVFFLSVECLPQEFEIDVVEEGAVSIALSNAKSASGKANFCSSVELYDRGTACHSLHVFGGTFPNAFDFTEPAIFIRSGSVTNLSIGAMRMTFGDLFGKTISPVEIAAAYRIDGTNALNVASNGMVSLTLTDGCCRLMPVKRPKWGNWQFSPKGEVFDLSTLYVLACFELLTLLASCVGGCIRWRVSAGNFHVYQSISLAAIVVFFCFYVVPLQSYFVNAADYAFGLVRLLIGILPYSIVAFIVVFLGLLLSELSFGRVVHFAIFAFLVYEYLEVGVLSQGAPPFIGDSSYYCDSGLLQRDLMVLAYVFIFIVVPYSKLKDYFHWMLISLFVMLTASLIDAKEDTRFISRGADASKWDCAREEVPDAVKYSANRNIIVLVVDSVSSEVSRDVLSMNSLLADGFDGFIAFDSNLGGQYQSDISTVCIFTGEYYLGRANKIRMHNFVSKACMRGSVLLDYLESPYNVYCMSEKSVFGHGYAKNCDDTSDKVEIHDSIRNPLFWRPPELLSLSVFNLSLFRLAPFIMKFTMYNWVCPLYGFAEEEYVYPQLRAAPVEDITGVFLYCHTHGAHVQHDVSSDGVRRGALPASYRAYYDHSRSVFVELNKLLGEYKRKGIYDCSTIFVIADHGAHVKEDAKHFDTGENSLPQVAFPMLWVKPANSRGPIVFDETTPTTHANIHKVLRRLKDEDLSADEIAKVLSSERRTFIRQTRDGYDEWIVKEDGAVVSFTHHEVE